MRPARGGDLFCGMGGLTKGLQAACRELGRDVRLLAVNHWRLAVDVHAASFKWAEQMCATLTAEEIAAVEKGEQYSLLDVLNPRKVGPPAPWDILVAGPECTHHSNARGGKPRSDQSRATIWCIPRWIEAKRPRTVVIENVPEFRSYGPLGSRGKPLKSRRGELFKAFLGALEALNYRVEHRILTCADYGDATTRRRLFIFARRGRRRITWPERTHAPAEKAKGLGLEPWRAAAEIIDWGLPGHSIFLTREQVKEKKLRVRRPLSPNTLRRIAVGISKYWGEWAEPFLVMLYGTADAASIRRPLRTVTAKGNHVGLVEPFLVSMNYMGSKEHDGRYTRSADRPLPTVTGQGNRFALAAPFLVQYHGGADSERRVHDAAQPLPTQDTSNRYGIAEPVLLPQDGRGRTRPVRDPVPTIMTRGAIALAEGFLVPQHSEREGQRPRARSVKKPLPTVTSHGAGALVRPFLVKYYRTGGAKPVGEPLDTLTSRARFGLVEPGLIRHEETGELFRLDIRFRMLKVHELAAAHGLGDLIEAAPAGISQEAFVKMIGNSVPFETSKALCREALR